eukprot:sb/3479712/
MRAWRKFLSILLVKKFVIKTGRINRFDPNLRMVRTAEEDITYGLPSLTLHKHLDDSEKSLLQLEKRSFELLLHACAQSTYLVGMLNIVNQVGQTGELPLPGFAPKHRLEVGFIGGGRLTKHIIATLIHHGVCTHQDIAVSTFQPEKLGALAKKGVRVYCKPTVLVEERGIVFVCVQSNQLLVLKREVPFPPPRLLVPIVSTLTREVVAGKLGHGNILKTDYHFNENAGYYLDEPYQTVPLSLQSEETIHRIFPDPPADELGYVYSDSKWMRDCILIFYRHLLKLNRETALHNLNRVLFGTRTEVYFDPRDLRIFGGMNEIAEREDQLFDIIDVGGRVEHLNGKMKDILPHLKERFLGFFKPKSSEFSVFSEAI